MTHSENLQYLSGVAGYELEHEKDIIMRSYFQGKKDAYRIASIIVREREDNDLTILVKTSSTAKRVNIHELEKIREAKRNVKEMTLRDNKKGEKDV